MTYYRTGQIAGLYSVFNDASLIEESMRSLLTIVDKFLVFDARYSGYSCTCGQNHDNSCDDTLERVKAFADQTGSDVRITKLPTMWEFDKRQKMFDALEFGDLGIVIDGDELLYGLTLEIRRFTRSEYLEYKAGYMWMLGLEAARDNYIRVHVKTEGLKIVNKEHKLNYTFEDYEGEYKPAQCYLFKNARMVHLMTNGLGAGFRPKIRDKARFAYNAALLKGQIKP